ncbi:DUF5590 domain-containing protein [Agrilactobacillus fermenti]|uniref:cell wall elongation regulator TseB-like domain-containing protein n=1 Tax=Agrilactobacillus fermenti TaxID=2586909 RepID=UPI001E301CBD|nr:DUF5590 domain-containing protein [Agrilactobacillus fermenti]MCD2255844.1 DUF5590 domain-containing protein [Agrilactobacillus fermenti]
MNETIKHWLYASAIIILISTLFIIYHVGQSPYHQEQKAAIAFAKKNTDLKTPEAFYLYTRNQKNWTVGGKDRKGHQIFAIIDPKTNQVTILSQSSGITANKAIHKVIQKYRPKQIHNVALGLYHKRPVWEVTFRNKNSSIGYETIDFKTGKVISTINNL